jgi:hypothetical protein
VVKPLDVPVDTPRTLLRVQELLELVVSTEGIAKLGPRHLVPVVKSGGVVSPPSTGRPTKLLGHIQSLLEHGTMQEPKLELGTMQEPNIG